MSQDIDPKGDVVLVFTNPKPGFNISEDLEDTTTQMVESAPATTDSGRAVAGEDMDQSDEEADEIIELRVSSSHLMLASPYFNKALSIDWKEGRLLKEGNVLRMDQQDGDLEVTVIVMNIIHGQVWAVPKTVFLEILARIAKLVDLYECRQVVSMFSDIWIAHLRPTLPGRYTKDVVLWMCISLVFRQAHEFNVMTILAVMNSGGPVETFDLPILPKVIDDLEGQRRRVLEELINALYDLVYDLIQEMNVCDSECSSTHLGTLIKKMDQAKLFRVRASVPLAGLVFQTINGCMRNIANTTCCDDDLQYDHGCDMKSRVEDIMGSADDQLVGVEIESYV